MYVKIEENILKQWANWEIEGAKFSEIDYEYFCENQDKFKVIDNELCDISRSEEYLAKKAQEVKLKKKIELKTRLNEIDAKRIRAIAEPKIKDEENGQTWLEYYNAIANELRAEIEAL